MSMLWTFLTINFAVISLFAIFQWTRRRFLFFDPLFLFLGGYSVIYFVEVARNYDAYVTRFSYGEVAIAFFFITLGTCAIVVGYSGGIGRKISGKLPDLPQPLRPHQMRAAALLLMASSMMAWMAKFNSAGGFYSWAAVSRGGTDWSQVSGYVDLASAQLPLAVTLLLYVALNLSNSLVEKVFAVVVFLIVLLFFFYIGSRSRTIALILSLGFIYYLPRRKNPNIVLFAVCFWLLFGLVSFQADKRQNFTHFAFNVQTSDFLSYILPFQNDLIASAERPPPSRGTEFNTLLVVLQNVPEKISFNYGAEFLQIFTQPIPRTLWPNKRYPRGELWSEIYIAGQSSTFWVDSVSVPFVAGPAPGFVAAWFYMGGAFGIILGGFVVGSLLKAVRRIYDRSNGKDINFIFFIMFAPSGFNEAVGHPLAFVYTRLLPIIIVLLGLRLITKMRFKVRRSA